MPGDVATTREVREAIFGVPFNLCDLTICKDTVKVYTYVTVTTHIIIVESGESYAIKRCFV